MKAAMNKSKGMQATKNATQESDVKKFNKKGDLYAGKSLTEDSSVYDYVFLVNLPDMQVIEMPALSEVKSGDKVDQQKAIQMGLNNAAQIGREVSDSASALTNVYTDREIRVSQNGLGHSLDGSNVGRLRTNARLTAIGGAIIQNAVPVNALNSKTPRPTAHMLWLVC